MTDRELLEMIAVQVGALTTEVVSLRKDFSELKVNQKSLKTEITGIKDKVADRSKNRYIH